MNLDSHLQIALASIQCFTDDGTLDIEELNYLIGLAMRDNKVDENERRVLAEIFGKVSQKDVSKKVWDRIESIKKEHNI